MQGPEARPPIRRDFGATAKAVIVLVSVLAALVLGLIAWLPAGMSVCENAFDASDAWVCRGGRGVLAWLETGLVIIVVVAPLLGAIAAIDAKRWRWWLIGLAVAGVAFGLLVWVVADAQFSSLT